jgi:hypothetical protein
MSKTGFIVIGDNGEAQLYRDTLINMKTLLRATIDEDDHNTVYEFENDLIEAKRLLADPSISVESIKALLIQNCSLVAAKRIQFVEMKPECKITSSVFH